MRIVVSDLDGTLLQGHSNVGDYTIDVVRKLIDSGVEFVIASGRGRQGIEFLIEKIDRKVYAICNNGANIYDKDGNCIYKKTINKDLSIDLLKTIREQGLFFSAFDDENFYFDKDDLNYIKRKNFKESPLEKIEDVPELSKIIIVEEPENILKIAKFLRDKYKDIVEITISDPECLDIVPSGCSKGEGVEVIGKLLNIPCDEIMAFGDGENDLAMLRKVGYPVAMENAQEVLKKEVKNIATPNMEEGVAKYIEKYFNL